MITEEDTPMVVILNDSSLQDGVSSNNDNVLSMSNNSRSTVPYRNCGRKNFINVLLFFSLSTTCNISESGTKQISLHPIQIVL